VTVDWGPVPPAEALDLADRLGRILTPLGRNWRPVRPGAPADLRFAAAPGDPAGEAYRLTLGPTGAEVRASDPEGRFYALVTLTQLLPPRARTSDPAAAAAGVVDDAPSFRWRGLMVDSARHFQRVETLEWVLELMALHKLNRFHWHLTDDQGWRLEVPGRPRLTEVGAWRTEADGRRSGGSYSTADVARIVAFAARRHIVVVPEIDLPGHSSALLAAYPELSGDGRPRSVPLAWGVADGVVSVGRPAVEAFVAELLAAVAAQFPGPWIHWGGDEVYRHPWLKNAESQGWMRAHRVTGTDDTLAAWWNALARQTLAAGKVPLGWDEAALFAPPAGTVLQWWDDPARALVALKAGHPIISSWNQALYLDYPEVDSDADRAFWMPVRTLASVAAHPLWPPGTPDDQKPLLWGLEAELFTERVTEGKIGRKLFPRLALVAELAWRAIPGGVPGWEDRVADHRPRLEAWGVGMPPPAR